MVQHITGNRKKHQFATKPIVDYTGKKFPNFTVVQLVSMGQYGGSCVWECLCVCGKTFQVNDEQVKHGKALARSCGCLIGLGRRRTNIGDKRGALTVMSVRYEPYRGNGTKGYATCRCDCGATCEVGVASFRKGPFPSCRKCRKDRIRAGTDSVHWNGYKDMPGSYWNPVMKRMVDMKSRRAIDSDLTADDAYAVLERQGFVCAYTGWPIGFLSRSRNGHTASIDRIDSKKGYTKDNTQWVHKRVNIMKGNMTHEEFVSFCGSVFLHTKDAFYAAQPSE